MGMTRPGLSRILVLVISGAHGRLLSTDIRPSLFFSLTTRLPRQTSTYVAVIGPENEVVTGRLPFGPLIGTKVI